MDFSVYFLLDTLHIHIIYNPGCAGGLKSITVVPSSQNKTKTSEKSTKLIAHDVFKAKITQKSQSYLVSKHGHQFGINDLLPRNPNQKKSPHIQVRT